MGGDGLPQAPHLQLNPGCLHRSLLRGKGAFPTTPLPCWALAPHSFRACLCSVQRQAPSRRPEAEQLVPKPLAGVRCGTRCRTLPAGRISAAAAASWACSARVAWALLLPRIFRIRLGQVAVVRRAGSGVRAAGGWSYTPPETGHTWRVSGQLRGGGLAPSACPLPARCLQRGRCLGR